MMPSQAGVIMFDFSSTFVMQGLSALREGMKQQLPAFRQVYIYLYAEQQG